MRFLSHIFLLMILLTGTVKATDIPGYIGKPSFELGADVEESYITAIKKINKEGAGAGKSDGRMDGAELATQVSTYPGEFDGPNFKPKINHSDINMEKAFADGYIYNYRLFSRLEFQKALDNK